MSSIRYDRLHPTVPDLEDVQEIDMGAARDRSSHEPRQSALLAIVGLLVFSNLVFALLWLRPWMQPLPLNCVQPQLVYSPATAVIRYEKRRLWRDIDGPNPFTGQPRPELDQAWNDIVSPMTIKISNHEFAMLSQDDGSIAFRDGSGYIVEMGMYHELHCIKRVRRNFHREHYYPNMTEEEVIREDKHIDHCLEYWRESVMCRGDTTLSTFFWADGMPTSRVYTDNVCVDWDMLDGWARQRMVDMSDYSKLAGEEEK